MKVNQLFCYPVNLVGTHRHMVDEDDDSDVMMYKKVILGPERIHGRALEVASENVQ